MRISDWDSDVCSSDLFPRLPYKECSCRIKAVEPCQCLSGLGILARRKRAAALAMNKHLHARFVMAGAKAHMIGGAFISKGDRNGPMDRERRRSKGDPKLLQCLGPFMTAMISDTRRVGKDGCRTCRAWW